jgi:hypothetical protein
MRAFFIFLIAAGAAAYGFLALLHGLLPPADSEYVTADQTELHHSVRHLNSWGTYLPSSSTLVSNATSEPSGQAQYGALQNQPSAHLPTPGESQTAAQHEPAQATQLVPPSGTRGQPNLSSTPEYNTAMDTGVEHPSAKTTPPTRKKRSRIAKPASHRPDDTMLATYGTHSDRVTPAGERRRLGFFLFGRFAARD